jgi:hypothetical protein
MSLNYEETKKMDEFVTRLFKATDLLEATNPEPPTRWKKAYENLWGMLDDLAQDMMNGIEWDEQYMDDREAEG